MLKTSGLLFGNLGWSILLIFALLLGCRGNSETDGAATEPQNAVEQDASVSVNDPEMRNTELNKPESVNEATEPREPAAQESFAAAVGNESDSFDPNTVTSDQKPTQDLAQNTAAERTTTQLADARSKTEQTPKPTAEKIEEWAISDFQKLELLTCFDGNGSSYLSSLETTATGSHFVVGGEKLTLFALNHPDRFELVRSEEKNDLDYWILCTDISADESLIAAGEKGGMVAVWNLATHEVIKSWKAHDSRVSKLAFSPNSMSLATTSYDGKVRIWEAQTGMLRKEMSVATQELQGLEFLSDQVLLVSGGVIGLWDIENQKRIRKLDANVFGAGLAISPDRLTIAHAGEGAELKLFDVDANRPGARFGGHHGPIDYVDFSSDGKLVATYAQDRSIRITEIATGRPLQVMDMNGDRVVGLRWLPQRALMVASESGRVRLWGERKSAAAQGMIVNLPEQVPLLPDENSRKPASSAMFKQVIELRSFPRLPDAQANYEQFGSVSYGSNRSVEEGMMFYRHVFEQAGWKETTPLTEFQPRLTFAKENHVVMVTFGDGSMISSLQTATKTGVSLHYLGNHDMRWLPKHSDDVEWETYSTFGSAHYLTADDITDVEVQLLKKLHADGWTAYSRLNASGSEEPDRRSLTFIAGGINLNVSLSYGAGAPGKLFVQFSSTLFNQSVPIPADSGFIEHDSSTELEMVANTRMRLEATVAFYNEAMQRDGWIPRKKLHTVKDDRAWLSFIRSGQSIVVGLLQVDDRGTQITVGDPSRSSWQLREAETVDPEIARIGVEAANLQMPKDAKKVEYNSDEKQIEVIVSGKSAPDLISGYMEQMEKSGWRKSFGGFLEEDYSFITLEKGEGELQFRARKLENNLTALTISGNALLWTKQLPTPPKRVSYRRWLERHRFRSSLDRLEEFHDEMRKIPASKPK